VSDQIENLKTEDVSIGDRPLSIPSELPILPLRDTVLFPNSFMPLAVARESSVRLIDDAIANGKLIAVFTQRDAAVEEPGQDDLHAVGTATHIHKMFKLPDGSLRLIVQGLARLKLDEVVSSHPYLRARVSAAAEGTNDADRLEIDALGATSRLTSAGRLVVAAAVRRSADARVEYHRGRAARGLHRFIAVDDFNRDEAGSARDARYPRADG
jgi:ATP-dependent Lon protease